MILTEQLPRIAPLEPAEALASFEVHPDFELELVAAEPLVFDPIAMAFDAAGRMFVVEMRGYSEQRGEHLGGIALLEDTDDDGVFDSRHQFVSGLAWPTAVICWDGGVFVGNPPDIRYYKDTDGDHVADHEEVVFTGFGLSNVQGLMNSFRWGLDNRIYGATSSSGASVRPGNQPDAVPLELRGRDFSFDPRTREIRAESGGGQHGMAFDTLGNRYATQNSSHIQLYHYDDRYMARNPYLSPPRPLKSIASDGPAADVYRISEVEPWRIVRTRLRVKGLVRGPIEGGGTPAGYFTGATGVTLFKGDAWPSEYVNQAFIGDVGSNLVHRKVVRDEGLTKIADRARPNTEFIRSTDIWFRPAQFANGPDGNLYIADMYREVIEHPDSLPPLIKKHLDLTSGNDRGRIYRVVHRKGTESTKLDISDLGTDGLVGLLNSKNAWHRETAARLLHERQDESTVFHAEQLFLDPLVTPLGELHALYALKSMGISKEQVLNALSNKNYLLRLHGVKLAEDFPDDYEVFKAVLSRAMEESIHSIQYASAFTLGEFPRYQLYLDGLVHLTTHSPHSAWLDWALLSSLDTDMATYLSVLCDKGWVATDAFFNSGFRLAGANSPLIEIRTLVDDLDESTERFLSPLIDGMMTAGRVREIARLRIQSRQADTIIVRLTQKARKDVADKSLKSNERISAIDTLLLSDFSDQQTFYEELLSGQDSVVVKEHLILGLRNYDDVEAADLILTHWPTYTPRTRDAAVEALFSKNGWLSMLVDLLVDETIPVNHLDSLRKNALLKHKDDGIRTKAATLLDSSETRNAERLIEDYRDVLSMEGSSINGKVLYRENCSACHKIGRDGHAVGPDLTTVIQSGSEKILSNILAPNMEVNPQYTLFTVETEDSDYVSGIISSETANTVTLLRSNGQTDTLLRHKIKSIYSESISLMPEEWEEVLSKQDFADLLAFLDGLE